MSAEAPFSLPGITLRFLQEQDIPAIFDLLARCQDYSLLVTGTPPGIEDAQKLISDRPPGKSRQDKVLAGIFAEPGKLMGVLDAVRDYPAPAQWWLGLLLLDPKRRGQGLGSRVYAAFEAWAASQGAKKILLGVVEGNVKALAFWKKLGFQVVEERPPRRFGKLEQKVNVMARPLPRTVKERKNMETNLQIADDSALDFVRALANANGLKIAGLLAYHSCSLEQLCSQLEIPMADAHRHVEKLLRLGILIQDGKQYVFNAAGLETIARKVLAGQKSKPRPEDFEGEAYDRKVLSDFITPDGRLREIPMQYKKVLVILRHILPDFKPGERYTEKQVNAIFLRYHEDYASLRRFMIDEGLLKREKGIYWRTEA